MSPLVLKVKALDFIIGRDYFDVNGICDNIKKAASKPIGALLLEGATWWCFKKKRFDYCGS